MAQGLLLNDDRRHDGDWLAEGAGSTMAREGCGSCITRFGSRATRGSHPLQ